jgi:ATP-binding cassette subfamily B protein
MYRPRFDPADLAGSPRADTRRVLRLFRPHWRLIAAALGCVAVSAGLGLLPPLFIKAVIDDAIPHHDSGRLNLLVVLMVAAPLLAGLVSVLQSYLTTLVGQRVMFDIRNRLYARLLSMPLRWFTGTQTGEVMSRLTSDVNGVQSVVTDTFVSLISNTATVVSTLLVMYLLSWKLATLALIVLPIFVLPTRRVGLATFRVRKEAQEELGALAAHMQETLQISGVLLVKTFQTEEREQHRFVRRNRRVMDLQVRGAMIGRWFFMLIGFVGAAGPALIYWFGGHAVIDGSLSVGIVVAFAAYLGRLYQPVGTLANVHVNVQGSLALFARLFEYMELEPEIRAPDEPVAVDDVSGRVAFEDVSFAYVPGRYDPPGTVPALPQRWALRDVSFVAEPGELVALVGPSGAGKTTITYLLPRLYDPQEGRITIDSVDIRDLDPIALGKHIGMVTQETFLFHTTVAANLRYARSDASDAELIDACRAANIHDVIAALPDGYDTVVGERGYRLSGGEKQRIAIARVILKNPRILVLDEATSSLDSESERLVQEALARAMRGRTSLVIAHRLSTVLRADTILVLREGRIVERGTHTTLLAQRGLYHSLYQSQFRDAAAPAAPLAS